jgi:hypothetical protein
MDDDTLRRWARNRMYAGDATPGEVQDLAEEVLMLRERQAKQGGETMATLNLPYAGAVVAQVWARCRRCGQILPDPRLDVNAAGVTVTVEPCECADKPGAAEDATEARQRLVAEGGEA